VGVGNPAEETCCYPNEINVTFRHLFVNNSSFAEDNLAGLRPISRLYAGTNQPRGVNSIRHSSFDIQNFHSEPN
jgi:hypothetical protein